MNLEKYYDSMNLKPCLDLRQLHRTHFKTLFKKIVNCIPFPFGYTLYILDCKSKCVLHTCKCKLIATTVLLVLEMHLYRLKNIYLFIYLFLVRLHNISPFPYIDRQRLLAKQKFCLRKHDKLFRYV